MSSRQLIKVITTELHIIRFTHITWPLCSFSHFLQINSTRKQTPNFSLKFQILLIINNSPKKKNISSANVSNLKRKYLLCTRNKQNFMLTRYYLQSSKHISTLLFSVYSSHSHLAPPETRQAVSLPLSGISFPWFLVSAQMSSCLSRLICSPSTN